MESTRVIAETERLTVRLLTEADVAVMASLWSDAQVTRFMGGPRKFEEVCKSFRSDLAAPPLQLNLWPVVTRSSGTIVGHCGLLPKSVEGRKEVELVYVIGAPFWNRGYATEAAAAIRDYGFHTLKVGRLVSLIDPGNAASERVALKIGMTFGSVTVRPNGRKMRLYSIAT